MTKTKFGKPLCRSIMAVAVMMLSLQAMAYDFPYTHQGKTLYYYIISDSTVEVTYYDNSNYVSGDVVIPSTVTYNGTTYSVTSIREGAFLSCSGLTLVTIPNSVTSISNGAFIECSGLISINVASGNTHYSSIDGVLYNYVQDTLIQCPGAKTSVTIPNSVTSIGESAFEYCSRLTSVTIPNSVTSIGGFAFDGCSGLTSVTIGNSVTFIGWNAFYGCSGLTSVSIPNSVTSIEYMAFSGCSGLTSVTIPNSVTSIERSAFEGCSGLTSVSIGNSVTSIGSYAFRGCSNLTTLNFNAINCQDFDYAYAPFGGTSLTTVNIGDSVQRIPANFVRGCSGLTSVTIGNSLTSIGDRAFYECINLSSLISLATVPPTIGNEAFPYPNICTVTVPCGSLEAYTASTCYWSVYFPQRITESSSFELSVSANEEAYGRVEVETQSCNVKTLTAIANEGYEFTAWNDGNTENPRTVTVTSDTAFVAIFTETETTPTITVTVNDATMGSATYTMDGNTAVLTATPNEGYVFTGWNDGNTENPRTVTITSDTAFMAIFAEAVSTPTITLTVNDETMGSASYTMDGNTAVLTATPNEGYVFTGWNDGNTENPRTVSITSDTAFVAIFTEAVSTPTITVTVNDETMGSATYTMDGNTAVLTATANEGYEFTGWNDGNTENPRTVTVTSDTTFMAIFAETETTPTITLTVNDETMGSASYTMDGNTAVLTATPNEGYSFLTWSDGNTENPRTVTVTSDTAFTAIFTETEITPTITVTVNDATMGSATYTMDGNTAVLTATPNEGYEFTGWNDGNTENPRTVTVTSDTAFMAIFTASSSSSLQAVNARGFALYPNPAKSFVTLEFEALQENTLLQILDLNGRRVRTLDLKAGQETLRIDLGDLPKGVYTIMIGNTTKKLIVE